jgi:hypothetical protein
VPCVGVFSSSLSCGCLASGGGEDLDPYFDSIATDILREVMDGQRLVKPALLMKYKKAWEGRVKQLKDRDDAERKYEELVQAAMQKVWC